MSANDLYSYVLIVPLRLSHNVLDLLFDCLRHICKWIRKIVLASLGLD